MIVDASDECNMVNFNLRSTSGMRQWDIKVTQHRCNDDAVGQLYSNYNTLYNRIKLLVNLY